MISLGFVGEMLGDRLGDDLKFAKGFLEVCIEDWGLV